VCGESASPGRWPAGAAGSPAQGGGPASSAARRFGTAFPGEKKIDGADFDKDTEGVMVAWQWSYIWKVCEDKVDDTCHTTNLPWIIKKGQGNSKQLNKYSLKFHDQKYSSYIEIDKLVLLLEICPCVS
jgi:hypothetical protein